MGRDTETLTPAGGVFGLSATVPTSSGSALAAGTCVGRYTIRGLLGRGGMGQVYAATDPELDRTVAIKILHGGHEAAGQLRIIREAQAMARLIHPNVITVFDVGMHEDRIFVAMELIDGETLTSWLTRGPRGWRPVRDVFLAAGRGLLAIHEAAIVHRDFKPDNVLVGKDRVVVADFGLARATAAAAADPAATDSMLAIGLTRGDGIVGTPGYIAPEVLAGERATPRSDQYSFCVALAEALRRPPRFLAAAVERGRRQRPADRYSSMRELLADLARDPGRTARRAALLVAVGIAVAAGGYLLPRTSAANACRGGADRLTAAWNDATRTAVRRAFLASGRPYADDTYRRVATLIERWSARWSAERADLCRATLVRHDQSAELYDLEMRCLGEQASELAALTHVLAGTPSVQVVDHAVRSAATLPDPRRCLDTAALRAAVPPPRDPALRARVEALRARVLEGSVLGRAGRVKQALAIARTTYAEARLLRHAPLTAAAGQLLGELDSVAGDEHVAEATLRDAVQLAAESHDDRRVARIWTDLVRVVGADLRRVNEGLTLAEAARAAVARAGDDDLARARLLNNLSVVHDQKGDADTAIREILEAERLAEHAGDRLEVASVANNAGALLVNAGRPEAAAAELRRAATAYTEMLGAETPGVARVRSNLGRALLAAGRVDEARAELERALAIEEHIYGARNPALLPTLDHLTQAAARLNDGAAARQACARALAIAGARSAAIPRGYASAACGNALVTLGDMRGARAHLEVAIQLLEKGYGQDHPFLSAPLCDLGDALLALGDVAGARTRYQRALALLEPVVGPDHPDVASILVKLGRVHLAQHDVTGAVPILQRAAAIRARASASAAERAEAAFLLARALWPRRRERPHAVALALDAEILYAAQGARFNQERAGVATWLARHPA